MICDGNALLDARWMLEQSRVGDDAIDDALARHRRLLGLCADLWPGRAKRRKQVRTRCEQGAMAKT